MGGHKEMISNSIDGDIKKILSLIDSTPDYMEFINSKEYKTLITSGLYKSDNIIRNREFTLHGDIRSIQISTFGSVSLALTIDNRFNSITSTTEVKVTVPENLCSEVIKLHPDTGVILHAKYVELNVIVDVFELVSIEDKELPLYFPYCVCMGDNPDPRSYSSACHRIFGYSEEYYGTTCPLCGSSMKKFDNVYTEEFRRYIEIDNKHI